VTESSVRLQKEVVASLQVHYEVDQAAVSLLQMLQGMRGSSEWCACQWCQLMVAVSSHLGHFTCGASCGRATVLLWQFWARMQGHRKECH
jgi:hypothetical protein